jgi:hypothetical protein
MTFAASATRAGRTVGIPLLGVVGDGLRVLTLPSANCAG